MGRRARPNGAEAIPPRRPGQCGSGPSAARLATGSRPPPAPRAPERAGPGGRPRGLPPVAPRAARGRGRPRLSTRPGRSIRHAPRPGEVASHVEVQDLPGARRQRRRPLDPGQPEVPPDRRHHALGPRPGADRVQERRPHGLRVGEADPRVHPEAHERPAVGLAALDQLVVGHAAAEPGRQDLLQDPDHVGVEERHAARGQLLVAPDRVEVPAPPDRLERAAAGAVAQGRLVAERHVEEHQAGARPD